MREAPTPIPASGEVRIRVKVSGVNFADVLGRMGMYAAAPAIPYVPGFEVSGTIDAVGQGVPDFREGDDVFALTRFGGYGDTVCVPYRQVFRRLEWMSAKDGAALPVAYLTAYMALMVMGSLRPGDRVLIHAAAGGVGLAALDICKIVGAETFGTASPHKHDTLREMGLTQPIDYRNFDFERVLAEVAPDTRFNLILDPLGGRNWAKNYRLLAPGGRLVFYGVSSVAPGKKRSRLRALRELAVLPFYTPLGLMRDNKGVAGLNLAQLWDEADLVRPWMQQIVAWYDEALFRPHVDRAFPFNKVSEAHHHIQNRENIGKVLLTWSQADR